MKPDKERKKTAKKGSKTKLQNIIHVCWFVGDHADGLLNDDFATGGSSGGHTNLQKSKLRIVELSRVGQAIGTTAAI